LKETAEAVAAIHREAADGEPKAELEVAFRKLKEQERDELLELLTDAQIANWTKLLGANFPVEKLGKPAIRVPELVDSGEWINSMPLTLNQLRGKVVIVHFYASECINCVHNYPIYLKWHEEFAGKEVVLLGIQTPEVKSERDPAHVRKKAAEAKLPFPILIDLKSENWNAWGNSMWPSVYLVDKQGYLRDFWAGELQWQGATGDQYLQSRIEELLAEEKSGPG
jgi:peroxiredoxin